MLAAQLHAKEVRSRLWHPVNGRESSEIEVVSKAELARKAKAAEVNAEIHRLEERRRDLIASLIEAHERTQFQFGMPAVDDGVKVITFAHIVSAVCQFYQRPRVHVFSDRRLASLVRPRQIIMFLAREHTPLSLPTIGRLCGGRDHTTVLHGAAKIALLLTSDQQLAADVATIRQAMGA